MADVPEPPWWRRRSEPTREKKPLTRELIVDAALALLERDGLQGLSMRRLAKELGSGAASLYWHVGDKEELLSLLLDRIVGEQPVPEPDPKHWQGTVKELARASRRHLSRRRDAAQLSLGRVPTGPNSLPVLERNLAVLAASGLPKQVVAYAVPGDWVPAGLLQLMTTEYKFAVSFAILIIVLLFKPTGLFKGQSV